MPYLLLGLLLIATTNSQAAWNWQPQAIAENVYALIGPTTGRTADNHALNANFGFVVGKDGVLLIDSGASAKGAAILEKAVASVTDKPIRWVINTGSQDHRWLGNDYFAAKGAQIIALQRTVTTQKSFAGDHADSLARTLGEQFDGTRAHYAPKPVAADQHKTQLAGQNVEILWFGNAHFPGDVLVWLPQSKVLFSGDHIYVDRMLGIHPQSDVISWKAAFDQAMQLQPQVIVPGHGQVTSSRQAIAETGDYLNFLIGGVQSALEDWKALDETVAELSAQENFRHLQHYDSWHRRNINRTYLQLEARQ